jgi:S1-C subfamily serine protease
MGALAGNPMLGTPPPYHYGGPPTDPNAPIWPASPAAAPGGHRDNRLRNGLIAGGAALVVLAAGIGIGHATWNNGTQLPSSASSNNGQFQPGGNANGANPFGNGSGNSGSGNSNSGNGSSGSSSSGGSGPSDVNAIASKIDPGLVDVNTTLGYQQAQAAGTGIVVSSNGVILTNNHVINGATSISVTDVGNHKTYTASVVGYDRTADIAVLQLHNASGLQTANLGNSSSISVGQDVVGVGNAGGTGGSPSAAGGTVTALNQSITAQDQGDGTSEQLNGLIETNANIQAGDSGGALVNTSGEVIGVDTAASAGYSFQFNGQGQGNQGFAIPINTAMSIARQIEAGKGSSTIHIGTTAFLGVEISPNGSSSSSGSGSGNGGNGFGPFGGDGGFGNSGSTGNTGNGGSGAAVAGVVTNGPAQEAGIAQGDVITSLGGKTINSADDLTRDMSSYHPGDKVQVAWTDAQGQTHTATAQLSSGPPQ